jgi:hypothetical protein
MSKSICKSNAEIALLLIMRPAKTEAGRRVQSAVLARVEIAMAIESALAG